MTPFSLETPCGQPGPGRVTGIHIGCDSFSQPVVHRRLLVAASDLDYRSFAKGRRGAFVGQDS